MGVAAVIVTLFVGLVGFSSVFVGVGIILWLYHPRAVAWREYRASNEYRQARELAVIRKREQAELDRQKREIRKAARVIRGLVIDSLVRQRMVWIYERQGARVRMSKPEIRTLLYTLDEVWLRIDRRPFGVLWTDILKDETLENLQIDIRHKSCRWVVDDTDGVFLRVFLNSSIAGVPKFFSWDSPDSTETAVKLLPSKSQSLTIPVGMGENRIFHYLHLDKDGYGGPHLLIAGTTGGGKSNMLNAIVSTLIQNNPPNVLQFAMIDLKRVELSQYESLPHLWRPVVKLEAHVSVLFEDLLQELDNRLTLFERARVAKLDAYNLKHAPLPRIVLVIDEWANVMELKEFRADAEVLLTRLARLGRAVGMHIILCTQRPEVRVVTGGIKMNIPTRIAFRTDSYASSMTILDNGRAADLPAVPGRAILMNGANYVQVQTPFISPSAVAAVVSRAGERPLAEWGVDDIWRAVITQFGGVFSWNPVWNHFYGKIPQHEIQKIHRVYEYNPANQGPVIEVDGQRYILIHPKRVKGKRNPAKRLIPVNGELPDTAELVQTFWERLENLEIEN